MEKHFQRAKKLKRVRKKERRKGKREGKRKTYRMNKGIIGVIIFF